MHRAVLRFLLLALVTAMPAGSAGQELSPLIVEGPQYSRTAFANWEKIELTYTVRYLAGYEPVLNDFRPQALDFGPMQLDPEFSGVLDIRNERTLGKESYFDVVYHLRYIGEKKGELTIPILRFAYMRTQSGPSSIQHFLLPEFKLAYHSVLTTDADDIKDHINFGSYQRTALLWKSAAGVTLALGILGALLLVFFRPVPAALESAETKAESAATVAQSAVYLPALVRELVSGITGLKAGILNKESDPGEIQTGLGAVCNGLKDLLRAYVPDIGPGATSSDMASVISVIPHKWEQERFYQVQRMLVKMEDILFRYPDEFRAGILDLAPDLDKLQPAILDLSPWRMYWRRKLFRLKRSAAGRLSRAGNLVRWRRS